jgi:hypothetical protein
MKEIEIKFEHRRLVFEIDGKSYFIPSSKFIELLNPEEMRNIFRGLDPHVKFADLNRFETAVLYSNLKDRGASSEEIAAALKVSELKLSSWLEAIGEKFIEDIKKRKKDSFNAQYQKLNEFRVESIIKGI